MGVSLSAASSSASGQKSTRGGILQTAFQSDPTTFDPQVCYDATCWVNMEMIFNRLYDYEPGNTTSIFLNLRVADIHACYQEWKAKGAEFVTPPIDRGAEIRCYMRDPDGYLIEVGQSTGLLHGHLAAKRPEDLPG